MCSLKEVAKAEYHPTFGKNEVNVKAEVRKVHKHYRVVLRRVKTILVQLFNAVLKNPEMDSFPDLCAILSSDNNHDCKTYNYYHYYHHNPTHDINRSSYYHNNITSDDNNH
nr:hypothetical protein BaRGS_013722 [Batillaria attramentaria]